MSTPQSESLPSAAPAASRYRIGDEPRVLRPDIRHPKYANRPMRIRGQQVTVRCVILVNGCYYRAAQSIPGVVRAGAYLRRNLELTRRKGFDPEKPEDQCFMVYATHAKAKRGLGRVPDREGLYEIPRHEKDQEEAIAIMHQSNVLHLGGPEGEAAYVGRATHYAARTAKARNEHLQEVHKRATDATSITEKPGRRKRAQKNPARLAPYWWSIDMLLAERVDEVIEIKVCTTRVAAATAYFEGSIFRMLRGVDTVARQFLEARPKLPLPEIRRRDRETARRFRTYAAELRDRLVQPYSRSFTRCATDFEIAADALEREDDAKTWQDALTRIRNNMWTLLTIHRRAESVLATVSWSLDLGDKVEFAPMQGKRLGDEFAALLALLNTAIAENREDGFQTKPIATSRPLMAKLTEVFAEDKPLTHERLDVAYTLLADFCAPY